MIFTFFLDVLVVDKTKTVCEKPEYNVQVHSIHKNVCKRFRSKHPVDTLLSHEASGEDL